jgi:hypothetical protein
MTVTRYRFRLSIYLATVVITALGAASPRIVKWAVRGRPPEYVSVEIDGNTKLFDARAWPTSSFNLKNRPSPLTYARQNREIGSTSGSSGPGR